MTWRTMQMVWRLHTEKLVYYKIKINANGQHHKPISIDFAYIVFPSTLEIAYNIQFVIKFNLPYPPKLF